MGRNATTVSLYHIPASADPQMVALNGVRHDQILIVGAPLAIQNVVEDLGFEVDLYVSDAFALLVSVPAGQNASAALETLLSALRKALPCSRPIATGFPPQN